MLQLGQTIMRGFALGFGLPEGYFAPHYARSFWCMRIIRWVWVWVVVGYRGGRDANVDSPHHHHHHTTNVHTHTHTHTYVTQTATPRSRRRSGRRSPPGWAAASTRTMGA